MDNASLKYLFRNAVLILSILIYAVFVGYGYTTENKGNLPSAHLKRISSPSFQQQNIAGVIMGGSSSLYNYDANLLAGDNSNASWTFLGLLDEGGSFDSYNGFISQALDGAPTLRQAKAVIYTTLKPYQINGSSSYMHNSVSANGKRDISLFPRKPGWKVFEKFLTYYRYGYIPSGGYSFPLTEYGSIDFSEFNCSVNESKLYPERDTIQSSSHYLHQRARHLAGLFPVADIYLVIPSEFYWINKSFPKYNDDLQSTFNNVIHSDRQLSGRNISLLIMNELKDSDLLCDSKMHANKNGRELQTRQLIHKIGRQKLSTYH